MMALIDAVASPFLPVAPEAAVAPAAASAPTYALESVGGAPPEAMSAAFAHYAESPVNDAVRSGLAAAKRELESREQAKEELDGLLEIGGEGPNGVSEKEYAKLVVLYSDINQGKTDIIFDAGDRDPEEARRLKALAMKDMGKMMQTPAGRELLATLADNEDEHGNHMSTTIQFLDPALASGAVTHHKDYSATDPEEQRRANLRDHNGVGNDAIIDYAPGQSFQLQCGIESTGDITLFHEMVHAYHRTRGTLAEGVVNPPLRPIGQPGHPDAGLGLEEYQAVGIPGKDASGNPYPFEHNRLTENAYRKQRIALGEDVEIRTQYRGEGQTAEDDHQH